MLIGFDASRAFVEEATGTENYSLELLKALAKVDRKNRYRVYLRDFSTPSLRDHPSISLRINSVAKQSRQKIATLLSVARNDKVGQGWPSNFEFVKIRPSRLWTQLGLAWETWKNPVDLLFVPAHTLPILRRRIMPSSVSSRGSEGPVAILRDCFSFGKLRIAMTSRRKMKTVVTIHDLGVEFLPGYHQFPQRYYLDLASKYAAGAADALIAVSKATRRDLIERYKVNPKKIFVVGEGVDTGFFRPRSKKEMQKLKIKYKIEGNYILYVGTVQPRKNLQMLIRAFGEAIRRSGSWVVRNYKNTPGNLITRKPDNLQLVIAGKPGWNFKDIVSLPEKLGIGDKVRFLGYVEKEDLPALYSGASVFAAPSLFEGFGLPILEALACNCAVIASDIPAHREILGKITGPVTTFPPASARLGKSSMRNQSTDYRLRAVGSPTSRATRKKLEIATSEEVAKAMILVKPNDLSKWTNVLYQYISQYDKRSTLVSKNRGLVTIRQTLASNYSWEETARQTLQVFKNLLLLKLKIEDN